MARCVATYADTYMPRGLRTVVYVLRVPASCVCCIRTRGTGKVLPGRQSHATYAIHVPASRTCVTTVTTASRTVWHHRSLRAARGGGPRRRPAAAARAECEQSRRRRPVRALPTAIALRTRTHGRGTGRRGPGQPQLRTRLPMLTRIRAGGPPYIPASPPCRGYAYRPLLRAVRTRGAGQLGPGQALLYVPRTSLLRAARIPRTAWAPQASTSRSSICGTQWR